MKTAIRLVLGLVVIAVAGTALAATILGPYRIEANSMAPNVVDGTVVYTDPTFARRPFGDLLARHDPERGDMIMFKPREPDAPYIKRVIGLPGETIQLKDGTVHIDGTAVALEASNESEAPEGLDGELLTETLPEGVSYDILDTMPGTSGDNTRPFDLPEDHYFVLGDNRDNSVDSRSDSVGFVPRDAIIGRAWKLY
ncbi:signal peptidase I [Fulvimarina pelagi HTCC2506]|uniref:Signal peptidase I n=1 Tax=Fulvimarina pelagi HTCC2506 TaxID=314231 RepID=Q0G691_9HYPH|nr:signal peptidase I [Fulvimarina pelagi]EAU42823.1 signal peptidase I [Fulvimarina pelagi HTCC2506]